MIRLTCPAYQARPGAPLSPILGQHQVKVTEFITLFDQLSFDYPEGLPLLCRIKKSVGSTRFTLQVCLSSWVVLFGGVSRRRISINYLYDVFCFRGLTHPVQVRHLIGVMKSSRFRPN